MDLFPFTLRSPYQYLKRYQHLFPLQSENLFRVLPTCIICAMSSEDSRLEEPELPWPQKGDQLFKAGEDWWLNSHIQPWNKGFHAYATGYKQATDIIVQEVTATVTEYRGTRDYVIYPVIFLYRHYTELRLKEIILVGNKLYGTSEDLPIHHRIQDLWKRARPILEHASSKEDLDSVESCLSELSQMDPNSESFRYPITPDGSPSIDNDNLAISLRHLREVMNKLVTFLDCGSDYLHILYDQQSEFEDYYKPNKSANTRFARRK